MARRRGFTLIELLVVIAIIAILASILFPVYSRIKESARRTACLNNLRQIGIAFQQYAQDNDGRYPGTDPGCWPFGDWNEAWGRPPGFRGLEPYIKEARIFFCPSNTFFTTPPYWVGGNSYWAGYCYWANYDNQELMQQRQFYDALVPHSQADAVTKVLASDIIATSADGSMPDSWNSHQGAYRAGGVLVYNDTHAKWKHFRECRMKGTLTGPPSVTFHL